MSMDRKRISRKTISKRAPQKKIRLQMKDEANMMELWMLCDGRQGSVVLLEHVKKTMVRKIEACKFER